MRSVMREILPQRRASVNMEVHHNTYGGGDQKVQVTCGFDSSDAVREVFTGSFKTGSDTNAIISDACVLVSLLLQHGYSARQIVNRLCSPPSLIGTVVKAAAELDEENR